ncbi:MAG: hypothetical protein AB7D29_07960 [Campylobacterales bacterium]
MLILLAEYSALLFMSEVVMVAVVRELFGDVVRAKVLVVKTMRHGARMALRRWLAHYWTGKLLTLDSRNYAKSFSHIHTLPTAITTK